MYSFEQSVWKDDFLASHSPGWWAEHIGRSQELQLVSCQEVADGPVFYREQALLSKPVGDFGLSSQQASALEIQQIEYERMDKPYMTIYKLLARHR
jgi:hypothetical protein